MSSSANPTNVYSLRASWGQFSNPYGRIVQGNMQNSYGPFIDPELGRQPHLRSSPLTTNTRRRRILQQQYY